MSSGTDTVPPLELQGAAAPPIQENEYERQMYEALFRAHQAENADRVREPIPQPSIVEYARPALEPDDDDNSNSAEDGYEDLLGSGLLKKKIIEPGLGRGSRPKLGGEVTIEVYGKLADGTTVDDHSRLTFVLGDGDVIQAFDLGVALMEMNEKSILVTAPKFAYGERGRKPDVPANATILYTVKVLSSTPPIQYRDMPVLERLLLADAKRERGNYLYVRQEYTCAMNSYAKALKIIDPDKGNYNESTDGLQKLLDCRVKCLNNLAACQLRLQAYDAAVKSCEQVLYYHSINGKALHRLGKAHMGLGDLDKASSYLEKAAKYENSKAVQADLEILEEKQKERLEAEKRVYRRMFGNIAPEPPPNPRQRAPLQPAPEPTPTTSGSPSPRMASANPDPLPFVGPKKPSKLILDPFYGMPKKEDDVEKPEIMLSEELEKEEKEGGWSSWLWFGGAVVAAAVGYGAYRWFSR